MDVETSISPKIVLGSLFLVGDAVIITTSLMFKMSSLGSFTGDVLKEFQHLLHMLRKRIRFSMKIFSFRHEDSSIETKNIAKKKLRTLHLHSITVI